MTTEDVFAGSAGLPSISFATKDQYGNMTSKPVGTRIGGKVLKAPALVQSRNFTTKQAEFWPDGNAKMSVVVDLEVDGVEMSLWVKKPSQLFKAFGESIAAQGGIVVSPGAYIWVNLIGFGKPEADKAPAKIYKVEYTPANQFAADAPVATTAAPAVNSSEPKSPEGYTLAFLTSNGWSIDQVRASYPMLVPTPAAPPAPPAPPAAAVPPPPPATAVAAPTPPPPPAAAEAAAPAGPTAAEERAAKIAAMSPEDRALLGL